MINTENVSNQPFVLGFVMLVVVGKYLAIFDRVKGNCISSVKFAGRYNCLIKLDDQYNCFIKLFRSKNGNNVNVWKK